MRFVKSLTGELPIHVTDYVVRFVKSLTGELPIHVTDYVVRFVKSLTGELPIHVTVKTDEKQQLPHHITKEMSQFDYKPHYERNLPHFQPQGAVLFITFRLSGSIPQELLRKLRTQAEENENRIMKSADKSERQKLLYEEQKRQFGRWDQALDSALTGPLWLQEPKIANIVVEAMHYRDSKFFELEAYTIMANHVHIVFAPLQKEGGNYYALQTILHSLKRHTARQANKVLRREGAFWQHESYDHVLRDEQELHRIITYIMKNPVKAGLVESWEKWPWTFVKE